MLVRILGAIDGISGIIFLLSMAFAFSPGLYVFFGILLLAKSALGMLKDFASWIDFLSGGALLLLSAVAIPKFILLGFGILLLQKAVFSFVGE